MRRLYLILAAFSALGLALPGAAAADPGAAQQRAYLDPDSGEFGSPPEATEGQRSGPAEDPFAGVGISAGQSAAGGIRVEHSESSYYELRARTGARGPLNFECTPRQ